MTKRHTRRSTVTPITPAMINDQSCPACGAILPTPIGRLDDIPGQTHLRRAVTVALTGNHSITFIGVGASLPEALAFGRICRRYGLTAYVTTPCVCGNAGDPYLVCSCTPEAIVAWRKRPPFRAALQADLVVEAALTSAEQRMAHRRGRRGESDEQLIAQAAEARSRPRPTEDLDGVAQRLLAAAIRQLQLTTEQIARVLAVAQSIARLADVSAIGPGSPGRGAAISLTHRRDPRRHRTGNSCGRIRLRAKSPPILSPHGGLHIVGKQEQYEYRQHRSVKD